MQKQMAEVVLCNECTGLWFCSLSVLLKAFWAQIVWADKWCVFNASLLSICDKFKSLTTFLLSFVGES